MRSTRNHREVVITSSRSADACGLLLRVGLGVVFVGFGIDKMTNPDAWLMYVPQWGAQLLSDTPGLVRAVETQGLLELVLGLHIAAGLMTRWFAAGAAVLLAMILVTVGWTPIGVRDFGLLTATIALVGFGPGLFSVDAWWSRARVSTPFPTTIWGSTLALGLVIFLLRPSAATTPAFAEEVGTDFSGPFQPIPTSVDVDERKAQLGQMLFHDTRLSGDQTVSCASCHSTEFFGADGRVVSIGVKGNLTRRNSPTVFNAVYHFRQFWDGRARTLEEQIDGPMLAAHEMDSSWETAIGRLERDSRYHRMFAAIYSDGVTPTNVKDAIAEFERTLITPNSPFDHFLRGQQEALTDTERRGYDRFRSLGCVSCHHGINLGGNSFQTLGKYADYFGDVASGSDIDMGRFEVTGDPRDRFVFKVPSLRNVAETGPYFHDGSVATLEDAVRLMGRYQLGYELTNTWIQEIVAFLHTLTGDPPRM